MFAVGHVADAKAQQWLCTEQLVHGDLLMLTVSGRSQQPASVLPCCSCEPGVCLWPQVTENHNSGKGYFAAEGVLSRINSGALPEYAYAFKVDVGGACQPCSMQP